MESEILKYKKYGSSLITFLLSIYLDFSGIGSDTSLMIEKVWSCAKDSGGPINKVVSSVLSHSAICMSVTTITTAIAFYSSFISSITAIACFRLLYK